jgi:hypothetical protein
VQNRRWVEGISSSFDFRSDTDLTLRGTIQPRHNDTFSEASVQLSFGHWPKREEAIMKANQGRLFAMSAGSTQSADPYILLAAYFVTDDARFKRYCIRGTWLFNPNSILMYAMCSFN